MRRRSAAPRTPAVRSIQDEARQWTRLAAGMRAALCDRIDRIGESFDDTLTINANAEAIRIKAQQLGVDVDGDAPPDAGQVLLERIDRLRDRLVTAIRELEPADDPLDVIGDEVTELTAAEHATQRGN